MLKKIFCCQLLFVCALSSVATAGNVANTGTRIISKMKTILLAGTLLTYSACGPLSDSSFMHRYRLNDARHTASRVIDLQESTNDLTGHVLAQNYNGLWIIGQVVEQKGSRVYLQPYHQKRLITVRQREIIGQLIDDHKHVGLEVTLPSLEAGIEHFVGQVFAVYDGDIYAIKISHKLDFSGDTHKLEYEDGNPLRFVHRRNLVIDD